MSEHVEQPPIDKSGWGIGPWADEPDRAEFIHAGFACLISRSRLGHLCGYVGVPETHPDFGKDYSLVEDVCVHGGLTYSRECSGSVCHIPQPGMPEKVWWLGFDCAHAGDLSPGHIFEWPEDRYRTIHYVRRETQHLAEQLASKTEAVSE